MDRSPGLSKHIPASRLTSTDAPTSDVVSQLPLEVFDQFRRTKYSGLDQDLLAGESQSAELQQTFT
ncbi:MAG: hypothetical protein QGG39_16185 [Candidatus Poribacteria bacterium]|nr:hypothetical protein [Candidatus Poribacteria bacterium]